MEQSKSKSSNTEGMESISQRCNNENCFPDTSIFSPKTPGLLYPKTFKKIISQSTKKKRIKLFY